MADFIDFLVVVLPTVIALLSVLVSIRLTKGQPHKVWWGITIVLGVGASVLTWVSQSNARKSHQLEVNQQTAAIKTLQDRFDQAEIRHTGETNFLQGQVSVFAQFAPAITKLAQATELNTRKQYEEKVVSNKDLFDATMAMVNKLHDFSAKHGKLLHDATEANFYDLNFPNLSQEEKQKKWREQSQHLQELYGQKEFELKTKLLPDAAYLHNELLRRRIPEPPDIPPDKIAYFFSGYGAAGNAEDAVAYILEQMAKHLASK